ncbi:MAG: heavy-metal-associated domain-containing protein [Clostridia bacterium]|nr:heavy-metal-associated domain-containing protein [Clostridia bacterium]
MCQCCNNRSEENQSHLHVNLVDSDIVFQQIKKQLANVPGIAGVDYLLDNKQAKITFDTRLMGKERLTSIINLMGHEVLQ